MKHLSRSQKSSILLTTFFVIYYQIYTLIGQSDLYRYLPNDWSVFGFPQMSNYLFLTLVSTVLFFLLIMRYPKIPIDPLSAIYSLFITVYIVAIKETAFSNLGNSNIVSSALALSFYMSKEWFYHKYKDSGAGASMLGILSLFVSTGVTLAFSALVCLILLFAAQLNLL